ncbi:MAG: c-type cytochrome biogenesis protein CcmI, partial [Rhodobacteraceae bacterium]|nr:c-type cytochrome biogenesis protein CcmI [Paracoccaceae bacterium]
RRSSPAGGSADLGLYRSQLAEVERDLAREVISKPEAERLRIEISRRILAADQATAPAPGTAPEMGRLLPVIAILALAGIAVGLYLRLGAPGYPDLPTSLRLERAQTLYEARLTQSELAARAEAARPAGPAPDPAYGELVARLRQAVEANPDDLEGLRLLARNEAALGNFTAAATAQRHIIEVRAGEATADDFAALADTYVLAAGGEVSPEAEAALSEALARDRRNGTARFYMGLMWAQTGRPDRAFTLWRNLLEDGPREAPWVPYIEERILLLARAAGVDYTPPEVKGPSAADIGAAAGMSDEDRQAMIRGMVEGLAERLNTEGGSAAEWGQLIFALAQLGETDRARAIWTEAQTVFASRPAELATVTDAAERAGVAE